MTDPKLNHYVPQFYLKRFADRGGRLWVWDKLKDVTFQASPRGVAAENNFYWLQDLADAGHDPYTMEKQLAGIEANASLVTEQWLDWFTDAPLGTQIPIPETNREAVSLFLATQYLRTADTRELLCALSTDREMKHDEQRATHTTLLWDLNIVHKIRDRIRESIWTFGRNETDVPFITSDNPVAFRTPDNRQWLRVGLLSPGIYVVYPVSPDMVMYCYDAAHPKFGPLAKLNGCLSPVKFDRDMVESENSGQVFMARRFVFSQIDDFEGARDFASSIGTDRYAPKPTK
jgi:Protein of unknown function (DUF4238)